MAIETPKYDVIKKDRQIEIRHYLGYINATVDIESDSHSTAGSQGFGYTHKNPCRYQITTM